MYSYSPRTHPINLILSSFSYWRNMMWEHRWRSHLTQMKLDHSCKNRAPMKRHTIQSTDNQSNISPSCSWGDHVLRRTLRDSEQGHKSPRRTLQLLLVTARGEDIEIFAIASFENLSLDVFVLLFCLHSCFINVPLRNKSLAAYKDFCFLKLILNNVYYIGADKQAVL